MRTSKYPPGTEYMLTGAESHLMGAISLLLSESIVDSVKALYKLRKAYQMLEEITKVIQKPNSSSNALSKNNTSTSVGGNTTEVEELAKQFQELRVRRLKTDKNSSTETLLSPSVTERGEDTVNEFIESGVNAMFGILQLVISLIPPTLGKVLAIVGFKGDRDAGLKMLWKAANVKNIHGSIALLALLQYFDGPTQFSDVEIPKNIKRKYSTVSVSSTSHENSSSDSTSDSASDLAAMTPHTEEDMAKTKVKLRLYLDAIREHYPRGALWQLQLGRMVAGTEKNLEKAIAIMDDQSNGPIEMKQVDGLMLFDKTNMMVSLQQYEKSAENFIKLVDLSTWSHALYYYAAGACYLEIHRRTIKSDPKKSKEARDKAQDLFDEAPNMSGKKKFMAKAMPFDLFVQRKVAMYKKLAQERNIDLVDAIGTSPIYEITYFWNGYNRMPRELVEDSLKHLGFSGQPGTPFAAKDDPEIERKFLPETTDEALTRYLLQTTALRALGRYDEAIELLDKYVLPHVWTPTPSKGVLKSGLPKVHYHKHLQEPWLGPSAIYERGVVEWQTNGLKGLQKARDYLELAANWDEDYELSTRVGFKIKSARDKLDTVDH